MTFWGTQRCSESENCTTLPLNSTSGNFSYCYSARIRSTVLQGFAFAGVPTVLGIDSLVFVVLLIVFCFVRKVGDYGRLALMTNNARRVDQVSSLLYMEYVAPAMDIEIPPNCSQFSSLSKSADIGERDLGHLYWLNEIFRLGDEQIREKCGEDAVHYMSFQRQIISLLVVVTVFSMGIILPVNSSGTLLVKDTFSFAQTTIANLETDNKLLWLHTIFALLYLLLTVFFMRRHTSHMNYEEEDVVKRTLFINGISKNAEEDEIMQHFEQAYDECVVEEACICYDVAKLTDINSERIKAESSKNFFLDLQAKEHITTMIDPTPCGNLCCCLIEGCPQEEAVSYYTKLEARLQDDYQKEREKIKEKPLGMTFVTFENEAMTATILKDFNACKYQGFPCRQTPQKSQLSSKLRTKNWTVEYAPDPINVYWEHLSVSGIPWWLRCFSINSILFILLFFLTTPSIIISNMDRFNVTKPVEDLNNPIITQFFPTLLMWSFSALLPTIVYYSTIFEARWTRSGENRITMIKCYIFLVFMVLLLPSLGLSSLNVFFRWLFDNLFLANGKVRFECVFLPDSGAFFVNYVIASAFIGNAMDLLRIPGLLLYIIRLCLARSAAERHNVKKNQAYEFQYGATYAWMTCILTVVMTYSITCPVIAPCGLIYMGIKYYADKYNMYFAFLPSKLGRKIHSGAVNQVVAAPILCLIWLLFFSTVRFGFLAATSIFTLVVLIITIIISLSQCCFGRFKYLSAHNYKVATQVTNETENGTPMQSPVALNNSDDDSQGSLQNEVTINVEVHLDGDSWPVDSMDRNECSIELQ